MDVIVRKGPNLNGTAQEAFELSNNKKGSLKKVQPVKSSKVANKKKTVKMIISFFYSSRLKTAFITSAIPIYHYAVILSCSLSYEIAVFNKN